MGFSLAVKLHGLKRAQQDEQHSPVARGILSSWTTNQTCSPVLQGSFLTTGPPGKAYKSLFVRALKLLLILWSELKHHFLTGASPDTPNQRWEALFFSHATLFLSVLSVVILCHCNFVCASYLFDISLSHWIASS